MPEPHAASNTPQVVTVLSTRRYEDDEAYTSVAVFPDRDGARVFVMDEAKEVIAAERKIDESISASADGHQKAIANGIIELMPLERELSIKAGLHSYNWEVEEHGIPSLPSPQAKPFYIAVYDSSAVRDTQVFAGSLDNDMSDEDKWEDLNDAQALIGCFQAQDDSNEAKAAVLQAAAQHGTVDTAFVRLLPVNKEYRA